MATTPRPGRPVRGSQTGRPIMALMDLLGRRWALRVIWELRAGLSPTVLNQRVRELRESGLLEPEGAAGYGLTPLGRELIEQVLPLVAWSARWAAALTRGRETPRSSR